MGTTASNSTEVLARVVCKGSWASVVRARAKGAYRHRVQVDQEEAGLLRHLTSHMHPRMLVCRLDGVQLYKGKARGRSSRKAKAKHLKVRASMVLLDLEGAALAALEQSPVVSVGPSRAHTILRAALKLT